MKMPSPVAAAVARAGRARRSPVAVDVGVALVVATSTALLIGRAGEPEKALWWPATVAAVAVLLIRHRLPAVTFVVGVLAALTHLVSGANPLPVDLAGLIGLFSVAAWRTRRTSVFLLLAGLLVAGGWILYASRVNTTWEVPARVAVSKGRAEILAPPSAGTPQSAPALPPAPPAPPVPTQPGTATVSVGPQVPTWGGFGVLGLALIVAWLAGRNAHQRRSRLADLQRRADELEREQGVEAALAVAAERGRISREMHDVVAHALSVVVLQAQGGQAELAQRPERTGEALGAIVDTGRGALGEIRRLLGALGRNGPDWAPQPGAARLPQLVTEVRAAGTAVELRIDGRPVPLPPTVDLAVYRIAQEALTNVMKHTGTGTSAAIVMRYAPTTVQIEVTDDGPTPARPRTPVPEDEHPAPGHGIRGMRERVTVLDGTFEAGPRPHGGFAVRARLPLPDPRP